MNQTGTHVNVAISPQCTLKFNIMSVGILEHFSCCYTARVALPCMFALFLLLRSGLSFQVHCIIYKWCFVTHHHLYSQPLINKKVPLGLFLTEGSFLFF